ncbi:MAG TPA: RNA polymerase sigma factor [Gemmataceae bacterium]|nr:RNA polymerase sigma factor [Gemmataceae bacterium]
MDRKQVEEPALIRKAQKGDRPAFGRLVEQYWDRLFRWLYHLSHDCHKAEDLTQETFLKAFAKLSSFQPNSNFQAWLYRIAYNSFLNLRRSEGRSRQAYPEQLACPNPGPMEQAMSQEGLRNLARAMGRLPNEFRAAFLLRIEQGLSFREIAEVMRITEETARWRVFKARKKLMEVMALQLEPDTP